MSPSTFNYLSQSHNSPFNFYLHTIDATSLLHCFFYYQPINIANPSTAM